MYLIYGLLASEAPDGFDRPLKKVRSKAIDEDALRLLDAARMERVSPEASLETYQTVAGRIESRLLRQRVLVSGSLDRTDLIASAERGFRSQALFPQLARWVAVSARPDGPRFSLRGSAIVEGRNRTRLR